MSVVGIRTGSDYEDTSSLVTVMQNGLNLTGITTCASGNSYSSLTGHTRKVRISYNDGSGSVTLAQDFHLQSVPYAWYANSLQGLMPNNFVQIDPANNITQTNLANLLTGTNYNTLYNLASGTQVSPLTMNNQQIKNVADPSLPQDAATKNYADTKIAGANIDVSGVGAGVGNGRVLSWNATLNRWEATTPSAITDATKLPLAGGTMAGNINMNGNQLLNAGHITLQNLSTVTLGKYDNTQQSTLVGTLTPSNKGAMWFNSQTNKIMYWDGAAAAEAGSGSGTISEIVTNGTSALSGGGNSGTITLSVNTDGSTLEVNGSNQLRVRDGGVTDVKVNSVGVQKITSSLGQYLTYRPNNGACADGQTLKWNTLTGWECANDNDANTDAVSSVFSRTGAITAQNGDYTASQVTNTPAGAVASTNVQAAVNELDSEKLGMTVSSGPPVPEPTKGVNDVPLICTTDDMVATPVERLTVMCAAWNWLLVFRNTKRNFVSDRRVIKKFPLFEGGVKEVVTGQTVNPVAVPVSTVLVVPAKLTLQNTNA
ncbi:MAG: hypothetical protein K2Q26_08185 [Bdellovibrionales bacterium]|nr:hypothetical protein [Bdellovibrionales bacterium]